MVFLAAVELPPSGEVLPFALRFEMLERANSPVVSEQAAVERYTEVVRTATAVASSASLKQATTLA